MDIEEVRKGLKTKYLARNIIYFEQIKSTQNKAKELVEDGIVGGSLVIANEQTSGVGTHGRIWYSEPNKNILMTLMLFPKCNIDKFNTLTIDIAKCIVKVIKELYGIEIYIKEPNDLMLNEKKTGGILTETKVKQGIVEELYIGMGLNVNQEEFPEEIKDIATSLKREIGRDFKREEIIAEICNRLENII